MDEYLSNGATGSMSRGSYFRVMALASMDILLTLPISVLVLITGKVNTKLAVWPGWALLHNDWAPIRDSDCLHPSGSQGSGYTSQSDGTSGSTLCLR